MESNKLPIKLWNRNFILLWQGTAVSVFGDVLYSVAIGYWVYRETNSMALMGTMSSISMFVAMFLNPFTGAIVDRINRKAIIVGMDALRGVLMLVVGFMALSDNLSIEAVMVTALIAAFCNVMFQPATTTVFIDLVPVSELVRAHSITQGTNNLINFVGKGISGALLTFLGVGPLIVINGFSFLVSAFTELFITVPRTIKQEMNQSLTISRIMHDVVQGAKDAMSTPGLNVLLGSALFANFLGSGYSALMLPLATMKGLNLTEFGLFMGFSSLAAVLAMAILGIFKLKPSLKMPIFIGSFILNSVFVVLALFGHGFLWLTIFFFLGDFMMVVGNALLNATMILAIPRDKRATVFGFVSSFSIAGIALSMLTYGFLAERFDLSLLAIIGTLLSLLAIVPIFLSKGIWEIMSRDDPKPSEKIGSEG